MAYSLNSGYLKTASKNCEGVSILDIKKFLKNLKLHESTISMVLGAVIIIITGVLIINYFEGKKGETISTIETEETVTLPTTHKIAEGEDLWKIAEKYYGSGYNWVDIAEENNITNPDQIEVGAELTIPKAQVRVAQTKDVVTPEPTEAIPTLFAEKEMTSIKEGTHRVEKGEDLWKIAEKYYGSGYNWVDIAEINNLSNPGLIEEDQELTIPNVESKLPTVVAVKEEKEAISAATYTVEAGDNLWEIAVRAYGDGYKWVEIAKENSLVNPNVIHPGNTLNLTR